MVGMNIPRRTGTQVQVGYSNRSSVSIDFPKLLFRGLRTAHARTATMNNQF